MIKEIKLYFTSYEFHRDIVLASVAYALNCILMLFYHMSLGNQLSCLVDEVKDVIHVSFTHKTETLVAGELLQML